MSNISLFRTMLYFLCDMKAIAIIAILAISKACIAGDSGIIELSLTADAEMQHRLADGAAVVSALSKSGVFNKKPSEHQDYSYFYVPRKTIYVLGARLISFEIEYITKYVGCCVNPGNAVILQPTGSINAIEDFSKKNRCRLSIGDQIFLVPTSAAKKLSDEERRSLVEVSCKDNYLFE